jgi:hypothetical protein
MAMTTLPLALSDVERKHGIDKAKLVYVIIVHLDIL